MVQRSAKTPHSPTGFMGWPAGIWRPSTLMKIAPGKAPKPDEGRDIDVSELTPLIWKAKGEE